MIYGRACLHIFQYALFSIALSPIAFAQDPITLPKKHVVANYKAVFSKARPLESPSNKVVDGPLLGNGDIGVVAGGAPQAQTFAIGKNDFWDFPSRRIVALGGIKIEVPGLVDAKYHQEQVLADAEVRGRFVADDMVVRSKSWVDAHDNLLVQEWQVFGPETCVGEDFPLGGSASRCRASSARQLLRSYSPRCGTSSDIATIRRRDLDDAHDWYS